MPLASLDLVLLYRLAALAAQFEVFAFPASSASPAVRVSVFDSPITNHHSRRSGLAIEFDVAVRRRVAQWFDMRQHADAGQRRANSAVHFVRHVVSLRNRPLR